VSAIFTASWSALYAADKAGRLDVQPVRISRGLPRFWPAARGFPYLEALAPEFWMLGTQNPGTFRRAYLQKLDTAGPEVIQAELDDLIARYGPRLILLCFESDRADCHRGLAAEWLGEKLGIAVPELNLAGEQLQFVDQPAPRAPESE
jgi:Protein of unknown function, DUF488